MRFTRLARGVAAAFLTAALVAGTQFPAGSTETNLPGGTSLAVEIDTPADLTVVPYGETVTVTGSASIGDTPPQAPKAALVYAMDVSGSTQFPLPPSTPDPQMVANCGNANPDNDTLSGRPLDCEITALRKLNETAIARGTIAKVGVVAFAGRNSGTSAINDAVVGNLNATPGGPELDLVAPDLNVNGLTGGVAVPDVEEVLASADVVVSGPAFWGLRKFTTKTAASSATNYQQAVVKSVETINKAPGASPKIVVMVSDGLSTVGINNAPGSTTNSNGSFPSEAAFKSWVTGATSGVKFMTFAVGANAVCAPAGSWGTNHRFGTLKAIAEATGGSCTVVSNPANLPTFLPAVVDATLTGFDLTVDGVGAPFTFSGSQPPVTGPATRTWTADLTGLAPGEHQVCASVTGTDNGGSGSASECITIDVQAVSVPATAGGGASDVEGSPVPIGATLHGGATFAGWSATPGPGTDVGAGCTFDDPLSPVTTVVCDDDGTFELTASTTSPDDARTTVLTVGNVAPTMAQPAITPTGTVFAGSTATVSATFTDPGGNDTHTCEVLWSDSATPDAGVVTPATGTDPAQCVATRTLSDAGTYSATMTVTDDDDGSDTGATDANAAIEVITLDILGGDAGQGGGFSGVEGSEVLPTVAVPPSTTLSWSVAPVSSAGSCVVLDHTSSAPQVTCDDNGDFTLTVDATLNGSTATASLPLTITNAAPVVATPTLDVSGTVLTGTPVTVSATFTDAGLNDTHGCTVQWSDEAGPSAGTLSGQTCSATRVLTTAGDYSATVTVTDDDGDSGSASTTDGGTTGTIRVTVLEIAPGSGEDGSYVGQEGSPVTTAVTAPSSAALLWTVAPDGSVGDVDGGAACTVTDATSASPTVVCDDDGSWVLTVTATMGSVSDSAQIGLVVSNQAPVVGTPAPSATMVAVNTPVTVVTGFGDPGANDSHSCTVQWGAAAPITGTVDQSAGTCTSTASFTAPNVHRITTTVTDDDGAASQAHFDYVVVFDPNGGFVTGGGKIESPAGSYAPDAGAAGLSNFGFNAKYDKQSGKPKGNLEFHLNSINLKVSSDSISWLIVSGSRARFEGLASVNGQSGYRYMVTTDDGGKADRFRLQLWDGGGALVFDSARGADDSFASGVTSPLQGGSVVIHTK